MADARILVVEDDLIVAHSIQGHLTRIGYSVVALVADGMEAVHQVGETHPDLVLMDIKLRGEMDGIEAAEHIRQRYDTPIIYLTAYADDETLARAKMTGPFGYLLKPFSIKELQSTIEMSLYRHQMEQEVAHLNRVLRAIRNVNQLITREKDRDKLLESACKCLVETSGYSSAWIMYMNDAGQATVFNQAGLEDSATAWIQERQESVQPACWQKAMIQPGVIVIENTQTRCNGCFLNEQCSPKRMVTRLDYSGRIYGVMTVALPVEINIDEEEQALFQEVAGDIAYALHTIDQGEKRQRAEAEEEATERKYRNVIESIPMGMFMYRLDHDGSLVFTGANPAADTILGVDNKQFIGKTIEEAFPPLVTTEIPERYREIAAEGGMWHTAQITYKDEQIAGVFEVQAFQTSPGNMVAAFWDVTETRKAEAENLRLVSVIEQAYETIVITDLDGSIVYANPYFEVTAGYTIEEALGQNPRILKSGFQDSRFYQELWDTLTAGNVWSGTLINKRKDGSLYHEAATIFPVRDGTGTVVNYAAVKRDITDQVYIEQALREERDRAQRYLDIAGVMLVAINAQGEITLMNREGYEILGYPEGTLLHMNWFDTCCPAREREQIRAIFMQLMSDGSGSLEYYENSVLTLSGEERIIAWHNTMLRDETGRITGTLSSGEDITERKRAETELAKTQALLLAAIEYSPAGILIADAPDVRVRIANPAALGIRGETTDTLTNIPMERHPTSWQTYYPDGTLYRPEDLPLSRAILSGETITNVELIIRRHNGEKRWILANAAPVRNAEGETIAGIAVFPDITDLKIAETEREHLLKQNQESARRIRQIVDTVPEGVLLLDNHSHILLCNPIADEYLSTLTGPHDDQALTHRLTHLGNHPLIEFLEPPPNDLWHTLTVGQQHFHIIARAVETGPTIGGWVLVIRDVTQELETRQRAQRQERLAAIGQLAAGIAHDFNNIISVIVLYSQMSLRISDMPQPMIERLNIIAEQGKRAAELINQILDFSRSTVIDRHPLDLAPLVKEQTKLWQRTLPDNIGIDLTYKDKAYTVNADPTRIQQVLMNLVVNARDAMPDGGKLYIELDHITITDRAQAPASEMSPGEWVRLTVSDTGTGIPEEVVPHIFEPFFTTKPPGKGTGLGLAQVYGIVIQHNGVIDVKTVVGQGTSMVIYLPALLAPQNPLASEMVNDLPMGNGETILAVEDNVPARVAILDTLEMLNYRGLPASNGKEALIIFSKYREQIALVLSDMMMPEMGGIALAREVHRQAPAIPFILMSGHPLDEEMDNIRAAGITAWIQKPPALIELAAMLRKEIKT